MLDGYISFFMNLKDTADSINTNFYLSSISEPNQGSSTYCDIQLNPGCMELDIIENNGRCSLASTIHNLPNDGTPNNQNCDRWAYVSSLRLPSNDNMTFAVVASFGEDGSITVEVDGQSSDSFNPFPSSDSNEVVVENMKSVGAVIESSQWFG